MTPPHNLAWSGWVDSLADDAHALQWRALVAAKQIALAYKMTGEGPESLNYRMMKDAEQRYTTALRGLPSLVRGTGGAIATSFRIQM
jgi:ABC-type arginine transport system permease subunit